MGDKFVKRKSEFVTIRVERHSVDAKPACMAWYGGQGKRRRACQFLAFGRFGTIPVCGASGDTLHDDPLITPSDRCPLWGEK